MTKAKAHDFLAPFQLGVACQGGAEKIIHGLRSCVDEHWQEVDFAVLKIDLLNAFNRVSRQAVLNACALHIPELLPWSQWCYGQHPALWHSLGTISSEIGVQQGDPLGPLLFCLVLQQIISAIAEDVDCESLLFHHWYIDDGVVAGPVAAITRVLAIIQERGSPLSLNINIAKCELFSLRDLSSFPEEMRRSNVPHFEILGAPIGDLVFCAKFVAQKQSEASKLLKELEVVGSIDPQVALLLLRQCGSYCRLVHLARNTPPLLVNEAFALFDDGVQQCFSDCTAVDASAATWQQAQHLLAENRKHNSSDKKCDELGWACIPLVVETYGCWGAEAVAALSKLAGRLSIRNNELKSKTIFSLYSRLGLTLVRANCRAILSRLT